MWSNCFSEALPSILANAAAHLCLHSFNVKYLTPRYSSAPALGYFITTALNNASNSASFSASVNASLFSIACISSAKYTNVSRENTSTNLPYLPQSFNPNIWSTIPQLCTKQSSNIAWLYIELRFIFMSANADLAKVALSLKVVHINPSSFTANSPNTAAVLLVKPNLGLNLLLYNLSLT